MTESGAEAGKTQDESGTQELLDAPASKEMKKQKVRWEHVKRSWELI